MRPLLERLPILRSRDFGHARAFLSARAIDLDLQGRDAAAAFEVRYNGAYLPDFWLGYIRYGAAVTARFSPRRNDFWLQLPIHGRIESALGRSRVACDARVAVVSSPSDVHVLRSEAQAARLAVAINGEAMMRELAALLGDTPAAPLRFTSAIGLEQGFGRSLARILRLAALELERSDWLRDPAVARRFADFLVTGLLLSHPHNYSDALRRRERPIAPRDVRRALDYIHGHLSQSISLADLVRESGVAGRTLLKHFRDFKGVSPMRYVRNARLQRVREDLGAGRFAGVGEAAAHWQFAHAGRFSAEYRRRFGESPSQTFGNKLRE